MPEPKVTINPLSKPDTKREGQLVGLSNCPNLTAKIYIRIFPHGETFVQIVPKYTLNLSTKPPVRSGKLVQKGLSDKAVKKILRVGRGFQFLCDHRKGFTGSNAFITLTYPMEVPDDELAKIHLANFIKRLIRAIPKFRMYMWVAERQARGALHFHILTPTFIPKEIINKAWQEIVEGWYSEMNYEFTGVYPHVKSAYYAPAYMAKYMTKEQENIQGNLYGISKDARCFLKPDVEHSFDANEWEASQILFDAVTSGNNVYHLRYKDFNGNLGLWLPDAKDIIFRIKEQIENYEEETRKGGA